MCPAEWGCASWEAAELSCHLAMCMTNWLVILRILLSQSLFLPPVLENYLLIGAFAFQRKVANLSLLGILL